MQINKAGLNKPRSELMSMGQALWASIPRESHAGWEASEGRRNPMDIILESNHGRDPNLIPIRYYRMLQSPFAFFRGSAEIMVSDLSNTPNTGILVQSCGDCHVMNFVCYQTRDRKMIFDINDFDETLPAPWEWDVKRLATSFAIASSHNKISERAGKDAARECVRAYREHMRTYAEMDFLEMWHSEISAFDIMQGSGFEEAKKRFSRRIKKAAAKKITQDEDFPQLTDLKKGKWQIKDNPPLIYHHMELDYDMYFKQFEDIFKNYMQSLSDDKNVLLEHFELHDLAVKVSGNGNVGTHCEVILCMSPNNEPLILQVKEARPSILEPFVEKTAYANNGERIVNGQRLMQAATDIFLGCTTTLGREYFIRQVPEIIFKPSLEILDEEAMRGFAGLCGWALARVHAKSGNAAIISGYMGESTKFEEAISQFATEYAHQNQKDYEAFQFSVQQDNMPQPN